MSAALNVSVAHAPFAGSDLPSDWKPDRTLKNIIPDTLNWQRFQRLPSYDRYAVSVVEPVCVYDLQRRHLVAQFNSKANRRFRVRLNGGKNGAPASPYVSRLVLSVTAEKPHQKRMQAHHKDGDCTNDSWWNLQWVTPKRNRKIETLRPTGNKNSNCRLLNWQIAELLRDVARSHHPHNDIEHLTRRYNISRQQIWRLLNGESRAQEIYSVCKQKGITPPHLVALAVEDPNKFEAWKQRNKKPRAKKSKPTPTRKR